MEIILNDKAFEVSPGTKVTDFLTERGFAAERVLLEINDTIIPSGAGRNGMELHAGDRLVALKLVAGG